MSYLVIARQAAFDGGLKRFYTGKPCKYGHDAERFVTTGSCVKCNAERSKQFTAQQHTSAGKFTYPLAHPDDHAAAWAYCQALDLSRGATPAIKAAPPLPVTDVDIKALRTKAFKLTEAAPVGPSTLHPSMAAQLARLK